VVSNDNSAHPVGPDYHHHILGLLGGLLLLRIGALLLSPYNLHGDEAQYWAWSKSLDWGYFTKPPGIAAVIAFFTSLFGDAEWAVRIGSPVLHSVTAYIIYGTARHIWSGATGFWAAAFYILMPGVWFSSNLISTDVPLLLCWALALNAWVHLREKSTWPRAVQLGLALGLGFLSKYAMLFFFPALILAIIFDPPTRKALISLKGMLALSLFAACLIPNMIWNMNHDFATLTHTAANADYEAGSLPVKPLQFLEFSLGQLAVFGPVSFVLFILAISAAFRNRLDAPSRFLALFALSPLVIIAVQALLSRADLNWAVTGYIAAAILTAHYGVKNWPKLKNWTGYNLLIQSLVCLAVLTIYMMPSAVDALGRANDVKRLRGWPATVETLSNVYDQGHDGNAYRAIAADKRIHFYALNYNNIGKTAPLHMWLYKSKPDNNHAEITHPLPAGDAPVLLVNYHDKADYVAAFKEDFSRIEELPPLDIDLGGGKRRQLRLWAGYGYKPTKVR